jgi:isoleucyl-tRNA synthetase
LKDRLYTFAPNHPARRSAQTVIYKITEALARLTAPILSFTADEVWQALPPLAGRASSVHLAIFPKPEDFAPVSGVELEAEWAGLLALRERVLVQLEDLRAKKIIGKSLEATVTIYVKDGDAKRMWVKYANALPELYNVSEVDIAIKADKDTEIVPSVLVQRSEQAKCERCWRLVPDVGKEEKYPSVCGRCAEALDAINFPAYAVANG